MVDLPAELEADDMMSKSDQLKGQRVGFIGNEDVLTAINLPAGQYADDMEVYEAAWTAARSAKGMRLVTNRFYTITTPSKLLPMVFPNLHCGNHYDTPYIFMDCD